jgi:hypothetical protein
MQQFLKPALRSAWAEVVAAEFLTEFLIPVHDAHTAFHLCFGRETFATFAGEFEIGLFPMIYNVFHTASMFEGCG